jgi:hypothetical protein
LFEDTLPSKSEMLAVVRTPLEAGVSWRDWRLRLQTASSVPIPWIATDALSFPEAAEFPRQLIEML